MRTKISFGFGIAFHLIFAPFLKFAIGQNLVPNSSFENYITCPSLHGQIYLSTGWFQPCKGSNFSVNQGSSSEYYNSCASNSLVSVDVPQNYYGYQNARTGNAYIGFTYFQASILPNVFYNYREYGEIKLLSSLEQGQRYKLEYYVALANNCKYSTNKFGAYFSQDSLLDSVNLNHIVINKFPQIEYSNFISDTMNWTKVSDSFVSTGGEQFLTLGNFSSDSITDTISVFNSISNSNTISYYYIDDVSLTLDSSSGTGELDALNYFTVYPNPAKESFKVTSIVRKNNKNEFVIYNNLGKELIRKKITGSELIISTENLPTGIYYWRCGNSNGKVAVIKDN